MQKESNEIASIFTKITEIIGTEHLVIPEKTESSGILDAQAKRLKSNEEDPICSPSVCRIVKESRVEESHLGNSQGDNVSPIVHKITEIVRAENATILMEERLEKASFAFDSEIVEKVLKRCFKVGNLALRFFNWLKHGVGFRHTSETYNTMIYIAGEAKEFNVVERLIEEMESESCPKDIKTWTILISSYGKVKLIGKALLVFERMRKCGYKPDETVYKVMVSALCNAGKAEIAMEFYKEMVSKNIEVDMNLYKLLLNCLSRAGNISEVRLIGEDMMNVSQIPEQKVYSCILRSFCIARKIREALKLLHELRSKDIMLDPENFEILVKGLCKDGKISDALEIVGIMKQYHVVNAKIHGILINGYLRRTEVLKAFQLFSSMKESGHTPTASTYTELLQQLFRSKEYDKACKLYDEMLGNGIQQDIVAMTAVIAGHIQNNCVSQAWKIYEGMKEKKIRLTYKFYSVAIKELSKVLRTDEALKLVNEMRHSKMKVGDNIFQGIISALNKKGEGEKVDKVQEMWRTSEHYGRGYDSVGLDTELQTLCRETEIVIDNYKHKEPDRKLSIDHIQQSKVGVQVVSPSGELYEHRLQKICSILSSPLNWSSMQEALEECRIHFTPELVQDVLRRCQLHGHAVLSFFSWVSQHAHYNHTTETYNMAIKISGCAKDFKHMRDLHLEMRRRSCTITSETWTIMIMQYGRAGLTDIALRKFQEMKVDGCKPSKSTFKYLIVLLCGKKGRKVDEAIKTFHQMINARHVPDKELVEIYLQCLCEEGKISDARWCMESLLKGGFSVPLSYSLVIRSLCRAGRLEEALALEAEVGEEKHTLDQYIYGSLVHGLLRAGRVEEALAKVETMKEGGVGATVHVHTSLIVHFFKEKKMEKALEYFKRIREEGCEPTIVTYSALIRGYMNMGMVIDARNVFRRMKVKGPYPDFKTYSMFITCLCDMGRSEEAMQLINDMLGNGIFPSTVNFRTIFYGLNREGKQDIARTILQKKWALMSGRKFNQSNVSIFKSSSRDLTYNS
ncbi:Pentatricopeptide repeat-containing protein [Thalictrum thalictroides]|uniref:Pentatricopeptide repeat-containing protein n=1 Tax=Thalictrum thalictroides TaxID=46969 RepID=A0A7J6WRV8_THATH|nr:Pentatricopeptide repeat-containing protein [Thalictrum thalictroides]